MRVENEFAVRIGLDRLRPDGGEKRPASEEPGVRRAACVRIGHTTIPGSAGRREDQKHVLTGRGVAGSPERLLCGLF